MNKKFLIIGSLATGLLFSCQDTLEVEHMGLHHTKIHTENSQVLDKTMGEDEEVSVESKKEEQNIKNIKDANLGLFNQAKDCFNQFKDYVTGASGGSNPSDNTTEEVKEAEPNPKNEVTANKPEENSIPIETTEKQESLFSKIKDKFNQFREDITGAKPSSEEEVTASRTEETKSATSEEETPCGEKKKECKCKGAEEDSDQDRLQKLRDAFDDHYDILSSF